MEKAGSTGVPAEQATGGSEPWGPHCCFAVFAGDAGSVSLRQSTPAHTGRGECGRPAAGGRFWKHPAGTRSAFDTTSTHSGELSQRNDF